MKHSKLTKAVLMGLIAVSPLFNHSFAGEGTNSGGGGSNGEPEFKAIASNIQAWIKSGNAKALPLPSDVTYDQYQSKMLKELSQYNIEMTNKVVTYGGKEKTCRSAKNKAGKNFIQCNINRFQNDLKYDVDGAYRLVHHEFAGLASLERNVGADSDYRISNHISKFLKEETVRRLPVEPKEQVQVISRKVEICGENEVRETVRFKDGPLDEESGLSEGDFPQDTKVSKNNYFAWVRLNTKNPLTILISKISAEKQSEFNNVDITIKSDSVSEISDDGMIPSYFYNSYIVPIVENQRRSSVMLFPIELSVYQRNHSYIGAESGKSLDDLGLAEWTTSTKIDEIDSKEVEASISCRPATAAELKILLAE